MKKGVISIALSAIFILVLTVTGASAGQKVIFSTQSSSLDFKVEKVWGYSMRSPGAFGTYRGWKGRIFRNYPSYYDRWNRGRSFNSFGERFERDYLRGYREGFRDGARENYRDRFRRHLRDWDD